jgi:hypothetical protein
MHFAILKVNQMISKADLKAKVVTVLKASQVVDLLLHKVLVVLPIAVSLRSASFKISLPPAQVLAFMRTIWLLNRNNVPIPVDPRASILRLAVDQHLLTRHRPRTEVAQVAKGVRMVQLE